MKQNYILKDLTSGMRGWYIESKDYETKLDLLNKIWKEIFRTIDSFFQCELQFMKKIKISKVQFWKKKILRILVLEEA